MGVLDPAMNDAELVQARDPCPQLITVAAGERDMIKAGAVLVDGVDVRDWPVSQLRAVIGYVEQDAPVLSGTLRENLVFGAPDATDASEADAPSTPRGSRLSIAGSATQRPRLRRKRRRFSIGAGEADVWTCVVFIWMSHPG